MDRDNLVSLSEDEPNKTLDKSSIPKAIVKKIESKSFSNCYFLLNEFIEFIYKNTIIKS